MTREMNDRRRASLPPKGAFCEHARMKYTVCDHCKKRGIRVCGVACPSCGLTWTFFEGEFG